MYTIVIKSVYPEWTMQITEIVGIAPPSESLYCNDHES